MILKHLICSTLIATSLCLAASAQNASQSRQVNSASQQVQVIPGRILTPKDGRTHLPGKPDTSLWVRYLMAGEDAKAKNDDAKAKQYWLAGLAEFQKHPPKVPTDRRGRGNMLVRLSNLEKHLRETYPEDWSKFTGSSEEQLALRKQQADLYEQFARINAWVVSPNHQFAEKARERADIAKRDYLEALKESGKARTK